MMMAMTRGMLTYTDTLRVKAAMPMHLTIYWIMQEENTRLDIKKEYSDGLEDAKQGIQDPKC
jgi:hypothetical protein